MQVSLTAAVLAATLAWSLGSQAASPAARPGTQQSSPDSNGATSTANLDTAKAIVDRAWHSGFPSASSGAPYLLQAVFTARGKSGEVTTGTYTDTWVNNKQWRREADFGKSRFIRSRNGKRRYRLVEGPDAELLQFVLTAMEPLPAPETVRNSDWQVKQVQVDGAAEVRIANGRENPDGTPDPANFNGFWFDQTGQLVKTLNNGLETRRLKFAGFYGIKVARRIEVLTRGTVGMRIDVTELRPAGPVDSHLFTIKRHDWDGPDNSEMR